ncbi:MAG: polymer-forming cytoskeletal protein [Gammaproteobacteria bacterium]|nr:polymer-forming cytoskeletal protein [Gammaproteobacteria bacterium]MDH3406634.1 polymer-forming cytoskeletal protein [Gammaproteobacteria bacterium]MDH5487572.1 polymer-forming cytoskeletal protein [Gammaproteobacteria bacterium]
MLNALGKTPNDKPCNTIDTLVGAKTEVKGDIVFFGGLRVDGKVRGNIIAKGEGNSTLVLSENATVTGNITVPHIITNGAIKGNVRAAERIELQSKAEISGDVYYKVIEMALGAVVNGNLVRESVETGQGNTQKGSVTRLKSAGESDSDDES